MSPAVPCLKIVCIAFDWSWMQIFLILKYLAIKLAGQLLGCFLDGKWGTDVGCPIQLSLTRNAAVTLKEWMFGGLCCHRSNYCDGKIVREIQLLMKKMDDNWQTLCIIDQKRLQRKMINAVWSKVELITASLLPLLQPPCPEILMT